MISKIRVGKGYEHSVFGLLINNDFDVYFPAVDDQGIDGLIRVKKENKIKYYDIQIKGGADWSRIRCKTDKIHKNMVLFLYSSKTNELFWLLYDDVLKLFPSTGSEWGDVFINKSIRNKLFNSKHSSLEKLRMRL